MIKTLYTILDTATGTFQPPIAMRNDTEVGRSIQAVLQDSNTTIAQYPEDFVLMKLGTFDDTTCEFKLEEAPKKVYSLIELKTQLENKHDEQKQQSDSPI